ncbi:MAG: homocysteine S-methyltransferase family protein, partial [Candidatus Sumerlaeota bacterium]
MAESRLIEQMQESTLIFDGAMGTLIYSRGVFINRCFEEISLSNPDLVIDIHEEYINAGAQVLETNTFGANRIKLSRHGIAENVEAINRKSVELALQAAEKSEAMVVGSVGPCLLPGQMLSPDNETEVREAFAEQIGILADAGVQGLLLETFTNLEEARLALEGAEKTDLPVILSFAFAEGARTPQGAEIEQVIAELDQDERVDVIGLNCGAGPAPVYDAFERARVMSQKPFLIQPNAGNPREIDGRMLYLATPEYYT